MSVKAMNWAMEQATGCPWAQCLLYVVADAANPEGVCWPSADWMAEKSQQSRATVYRRLAELREMGLLALFPRWLDDAGKVHYEGAQGRRQTSPEIRLIFSAKISLPRKRRRLSDDDEGAQESGEDDTPLSHVATPPCRSVATPPVAAERQGPSHCGDNNQESKPEDSPPNPPSGGGQVVDQEFEDQISEAIRLYPAPITDLPKFRNVMAALTTIERRSVLTAMRAYSAYIADLEARGKSRSVKDAHRWVAQGQWQGFVAAGEKIEIASLRQEAPIDSEPGKAWATLHRIAHISPLASAGNYSLPRALTDQELALAKAPDEGKWMLIEPDQVNQCGAWNELLAHVLAGKARPPLVWDRNRGGKRGFMAPWPFPPRKDGTIPQPTEQQRGE